MLIKNILLFDGGIMVISDDTVMLVSMIDVAL